MACFVLSLFPLDVLDEICDVIESVSEGMLTFSCSALRKKALSLYYPDYIGNRLWPVMNLQGLNSKQNFQNGRL